MSAVQEPVRLLSFHTTKIVNAPGHNDIYFVEFDCDIEFLQDCYWMEGRLFTSTVRGATNVPRKKGDRARVSDTMALRKMQNVWMTVL
jgi:hypothetical protein